MSNKDLSILDAIENLVKNKYDLILIDVVSFSLEKRDELGFSDQKWFDEVTDNLVTLDSAATYSPKTQAEAEKIALTIAQAKDNICHLVSTKRKQIINPVSN